MGIFEFLDGLSPEAQTILIVLLGVCAVLMVIGVIVLAVITLLSKRAGESAKTLLPLFVPGKGSPSRHSEDNLDHQAAERLSQTTYKKKPQATRKSLRAASRASRRPSARDTP